MERLLYHCYVKIWNNGKKGKNREEEMKKKKKIKVERSGESLRERESTYHSIHAFILSITRFISLASVTTSRITN